MLVRAFEFELAVLVQEIGTRLTIFQKHFFINDLKAGHQMLLLLKSYVRV